MLTRLAVGLSSADPKELELVLLSRNDGGDLRKSGEVFSARSAYRE